MPRRTRFDAVGDGDTVEFEVPEHPILSSRLTVDGALQVLTTDYALDEQLGVITFVDPPAPEVPVVCTYTWAMFTDAQLQAFLDMEAGNVRLAAADVFDAMAANILLYMGKITMLDVQLDGPAAAKTLHDMAKALRDLEASGDIEPPTVETEDPGFAIAEMVFPTNAAEKLRAEIMRGGA